MKPTGRGQTATTPTLTIDLHLPAGAGDRVGAWALARPGHVLAEGCFAVPRAERYRLVIDNAGIVPDGEVDCHITLNGDDRVGAFPSFGDYYARTDLNVVQGRARGTVQRDAWSVRRLSAPDHRVTIHYHRYEGDYADATIWTWDATRSRTPEDNELYPVGHDDFGLIFELDTALYGADEPNDRIGLLPRFGADWNRKDGTDRFWTPALGREVWLIGGRQEVFARRPDITPHVAKAFLDGRRSITLVLSHPVQQGVLFPAAVELTGASGRRIQVEALEPLQPIREGRTRHLSVRVADDLSAAAEEGGLTIAVKGYRGTDVVPRRILSDPQLFFDPSTPLGALYSRQKTIFRVFAPTARAVTVVVSPHPRRPAVKSSNAAASSPASGEAPTPPHRPRAGDVEYAMRKIGKGIWEAEVEGDLVNHYYAYKVNAPGLDPDEEVVDPYARSRAGHDGRGLIVDMRATDPPGFDPRRRPPLDAPTDAVIYEVHVRGMTIDRNSGVRHKGRFLGLADAAAHHPADPAVLTALAHARELGVTHLQLMPIQDFDNVEPSEEYNWGYMPVNYFYPDGMFATEVDSTARITEFKRLVQAIHDAGLRVVMDVVFNHTAAPAPFDRLVPNYYYRMTEDGNYWNGSGTGNELDTEQPMVRRLIVECCRFWVEEYGVDGFRFDLMGLIDLETLQQVRDAVRAVDPSILVYGEPWSAGPSGLARLSDKQRLRTSKIGAFNDHFRDAIKGSPRGAGTGYVQNGADPGALISGLQASIFDWAWSPDEVIQYCSAHDDLCLRDKLEISQPEASSARIKQLQKFALGCILVAQGIPFIYSGEDIFRTKQHIDNAYNAGDEVNKIHWDWKREHRDVFDYVRGLIALRRAHSLFRLRTSDDIKRRQRFNTLPLPSPKAVVMSLDGRTMADESAEEILVLFNPEERVLEFPLPPGEWLIVCDEREAGPVPLRTTSGRTGVAPSSLQVLLKPKTAAEPQR
ncbi:MAG: type I pullulanase [Candidatus Sumerlaeia bacterium]